jgi:hypothetical protein
METRALSKSLHHSHRSNFREIIPRRALLPLVRRSNASPEELLSQLRLDARF